jgi:large subunit ribosomal protein L4
MEIIVSGGDKVSVSDEVFDRDYNEGLIHQAVVSYMAAARSGTSAQKTRSEVSGGGAKPWRQKGTGRARAGTIRSPIWRSGGITFASKTRDYTKKINKKMYRAAIRSIFSKLIKEDRLIVVNKLDLSEPKTKLMSQRLVELGVDDALLVTNELNSNVFLASRNIKNISAIDASAINPLDLVSFKKVVIELDALKAVEGKLQ